MKLLLDTNILVDLIACREPYASAARKLCIASVFGDVQLWASTQSFADAFYILRKNAPDADVKQALLASLEFLVPCGTCAADLEPALKSDWPDVEDFLIVGSSKHIKADYFITRDAELARLCPIKALDADAFLQWMKDDKGISYDDISL